MRIDSNTSRLFESLLFCLIAYGVVLAFYSTFVLWRIDDDIVDLVMIRDGVAEHGWQFLTSWYYTYDNWFLSLLPIASLLYATCGAHPGLLIGFGWGVYVSNVLAASLLGAQLAGLRLALVLACVLAFPNPLMLGGGGMLSYPVTHNSTLFWVLVTLNLACLGISRSRLWSIAASGSAMLAGVSDPWTVPVIVLPVLIACLALAYLQPRARAAFLTLSFGMTAALIMVRTRLFGILGFLPRYQPSWAGWSDLEENGRWIAHALGAMFQLVPGRSGSTSVASLISFGLLTLLLLQALIHLRRGGGDLNLGSQMTLLSAALSIAGIVLAVMCGRLPHSLVLERFLLNIWVFAPLLILFSMLEQRKWLAVLPVAWSVLLIANGAIGMRSMLTSTDRPDPTADFAPLATLLRERGLTYGFGPYWGAHANAVTWYTGGAVRLRPVVFDAVSGQIVGRHQQSSRFWARPDDQMRSDPRFFVAIGQDGEYCPIVEVCLRGVTRQFGAPDEVLSARTDRATLSVLIWDHPTRVPWSVLQ